MNESIGSMVFWGAFWLADLVAMCWIVGNHDRPAESRPLGGPPRRRLRGYAEAVAECPDDWRWN